jgi:hypothetical protein
MITATPEKRGVPGFVIVLLNKLKTLVCLQGSRDCLAAPKAEIISGEATIVPRNPRKECEQ